MARFEITPYSDFEHCILLENVADEKVNEYLMYFRFVALLFQIVLLNQAGLPIFRIFRIFRTK